MLCKGKELAVILKYTRNSIEKVQPLNFDKIINSSKLKEIKRIWSEGNLLSIKTHGVRY
jgi:hypothetical protein